ncbi:hypothetical protein WJX72_004145 [[Myrmecia] bisecta]|uniref:Complex 1 LYR protein domain-containing protein n=1 Tax=[Myrmecia] bisecta TaxID=41462 RepID=A0AAW1PY64_9CHLO
MPPDPARALSLYRQILRVGRTWSGPSSERAYIWDEAQRLFRQNQHLTDAEAIEHKLDEAESRLEYAVHYHIPYPRLEHMHQFKPRQYMEPPKLDTSSRAPSSRDAEVADKLAAAAARRRATQQQELANAGEDV